MRRVVANKYEVLRSLGSGGTGEVLEAQHLTLSNRRVALKHLHASHRGHEELVERFLREAQTADALDHPHIVEIIDVEQDEELGFVLVMELLEGKGLDELRNDGPMPWTRACRIMGQALDALGLAHRAGIIHRDLKPANFHLVERDGQDHVKVLDFGIAHVASDDKLTVPGHFFGTPRYASPEQRLDASRVGPEADVYAMGITLLELVKGDRATLSPASALDARVQIDVDEDQLPGPLEAVVARAVSFDAAARYPDAEAMRDALDEALIELGGEPLPPSALATRGAPEPIELRSEPPRRRGDEAKDTVAAAPRAKAAPPADEGAPHAVLEPTVSDRGSRSRPTAADSGGSSTNGRAPEPPASDARVTETPQGWRRWVVGGAAVVLLSSGAWLWSSSSERREPWASPAPPSSSVVPGLPASPSTVPIGAREHAIARRACEVWADALSKHQQPDGRFGTEAHRPASGWTTGQMITGLSASHRACGKPGTSPLMEGLRALDKGREKLGWRGVGSRRVEMPATAWATLAFAGAGPLLGNEEAKDEVRAAVAILAATQKADGSMPFLPEGDDVTNDYATVLGIWALVDARELAGIEATAEADLAAALDWLRSVLIEDRGEPPLRRVAGLQEQAVWVWLRARAAGLTDAADAKVGQSVARDIIERCSLDAARPRRCQRPIYEDGRTYLDRTDKGPNLLTLWHPWVVAAAQALLRDEGIELSKTDRTALSAIVRWGLHELEAGVSLIATAPGYKLAEYLIAVSDVVPARGRRGR